MSDRPPFPIRLTDHDHILRLAQDLIAWDDPAAQARAKAFFLPEKAQHTLLESVFAPLRDLCRPTVSAPGTPAAEARVLLSRRGAVDRAALTESGKVALVQRIGERPKGLDISACKAHGVAVSLLPRRSLTHVADHAMLLILALSRRVEAMQAGLRDYRGTPGEAGAVSYNWPGVEGMRALAGQTLGIVGMGEIGWLLARRAEAFGMHIVWTARSAQAGDGLPQTWQRRHFPDLLAQADVVTLHVPPTGLSGPLIGHAELALMKPGALLINTARGALIDEQALLAALQSGLLAGAGLDVHAREPVIAADPLRALPNVLATPHVAGGSRLEVLQEMRAICDNLVDTLNGQPPRHGRVPA
ncbi:2-hydroxyacid dehydrogenase [Pararhodobacter aggregans]|nr:NAD(P)-dependent oxidoreductase [Pararhodobacter aggregans]PTW99439.1 glyoxylate reductase/glycerate dehydrogenase/D-3-phosphoglycerate dehydrogenase [Pararhodobacter aggregans]